MIILPKIAVTGASGFIGRQVLIELIKRQQPVVAITRDKTRLTEFESKIKITEFNLVDAHDGIFDYLGRPDILLHLAWDGLPNYFSLHHIEHGLPNQYRFLQCMVTQGLKTLLVTGTCFEYGLQSGPLSENIETRPANPYGFAKDTLRKQLEYFKKKNPFNLIWARLFYLYGEGQPETSLHPQLRKAVETGSSQFNMSGGEQLRDYLPVEEVARYLVMLAIRQKDFGVVNVCSGVPCSVRMLVERWLTENRWKINLNLGYYPYPSYEPMAFWGNREKLVEALKS